MTGHRPQRPCPRRASRDDWLVLAVGVAVSILASLSVLLG